MPAKHTLGKNERLKRRKLIDQLFQEGKSYAAFPVRVHYKIYQNVLTTPLQAGFTVSSRHFKKAVDRNRIKRVLREAYRKQKSALHQSLQEKQRQMAIFFIYTGRELPAGNQVSEKIAVLLKKLTGITNEMDSAGS